MISRDPPPSFTKQRIAQLSEQALREAGVVGELPTPMDAVQAAVGVREVVDLSARTLPKAVVAKKPSRMGRVLGAFVFKEKVVYVDRGEAEVRVLFTDAHETVHAMCPWHGPSVRADDKATLSDTHDAVESEANYGAGQLIFQGGRFHRRALKEQVSIRTPLELAREYGASKHATLHFYVEEHPDAVALLIAGRYPSYTQELPIWRSVESPTFLRLFGRLVDPLPGHVLSVGDGPLAGIVQQAQTQLDPPSVGVTIPDGDGDRHAFVAEAFFNQSCNFVLVTETKARRLGRRVRLAS